MDNLKSPVVWILAALLIGGAWAGERLQQRPHEAAGVQQPGRPPPSPAG